MQHKSQMNPYKIHLDDFFNRVIELRHIASHINTILISSIKLFEGSKFDFLSGSALVISDWTGPTDNGWEINFHTGIRKITFKENYKDEVEKIISQECCLAFAQSYEALERFLKDCVFTRIKRDNKFQEQVGLAKNKNILRQDIPGGEKIFKWIKKAGDPKFSNFSKNNNNNLRFKEFWSVLSESRHAIIHSSSVIEISKINKSEDHKKIFHHFFISEKIDDSTISIVLNYRILDELLKKISELAFQIFKSLSLKENLEWEINKK